MTIQEDPSFTTNHQYDSSEVSTKLSTVGGNNCEYGTVEAACIKVAGTSDLVGGRSIWPAFWMLGDNITQVGGPGAARSTSWESVGWLENAGGTLGSQNDGTIHGPQPNGAGGIMDYNGGNGSGVHTNLPNGEKMYAGYHLYGVTWSPGSITWSVDGVPYGTETPATIPSGGTWVFDNHPFYLILNVNAGGAFGGSTVLNDTLNMDVAYVMYNANAYSGTGSGTEANLPTDEVSYANTSATAQDAAIVPEPGTISLLRRRYHRPDGLRISVAVRGRQRGRLGLLLGTCGIRVRAARVRIPVRPPSPPFVL